MGAEDVELVQDVGVLGVAVEGHHLYVDLYGGPENVCASVRFVFPDARERAQSLASLQGWQWRATPVSLLVAGPTVRLVSERALFARALAPADLD